jgi:hypothetical protein
VERRQRVIRVMVNSVNWQQEEPTGVAEGRQLNGWHEPCDWRQSRTVL